MRGHKDKPPDGHRRLRRLHSLLLALLLGLSLLLARADAFAGPAAGGLPSPSRGGKQQGGKGGGGGGWRRRGGGAKGKGKGKTDEGGPKQEQQQEAPRIKPRLMPATQAKDAREAAYLGAFRMRLRSVCHLYGGSGSHIHVKAHVRRHQPPITAALAAERDQQFISDALQEWAQAKKPSGSEMYVLDCCVVSPYRINQQHDPTQPNPTPRITSPPHRGLATLVASVACREAASLDYAIRALADGGGDTPDANGGKGAQLKAKPVRLKARQRVVLRAALAQYKYCTNMPIYAIVDHAVGLAKRYGGGPPFAAFANALLRKLPADDDGTKGKGGSSSSTTRLLPLPAGDSVDAWAAALSFPPFLVRLLIEDFGRDGARRVMEASNTFPPTMARARTGDAAGKCARVDMVGVGASVFTVFIPDLW